MAGIRVVTDSACDLPPALAEERAIEIVPLTIRFGEEEFVDRYDLSPAEFWARCTTSRHMPETAAPSPGAFEEIFRRAAADGCEGVVCLNLSSELSATIQAARSAAMSVTEAIPVRVLDSRSLTMGLGLMAVAAADAAAAGKGIDDVAGAAEDLVGRTRVFAALDTLENLRRGGRIGGAQAFIGSMLSIKPIVEVSKGFVESESKQRTRSKALRYLVERIRQQPRVENLAVMHGDAPDLEEFLDMVSEVYPRQDIIVGYLGPVIGAHSGPRAMGITFQVPR